MTHISRRRFVAGTAAGLALGPSSAFAVRRAPKLRLAFVGVGGRGMSNLKGLAPGNTVAALCDVDDVRAAEAFKMFPDAKRYRDYRAMLDEMHKDIDAVAISTPDHTHAVTALAAIGLGKHVYCEKPLAHSVREVRALMKAAKEKGVVTQLGNQGHSTDSIRKMVEWVREGAIGKVREVHASCSISHWKGRELPKLGETHDVPPTLDWNLWLGPAKQRPFNPMYLPGKWRGWSAFGMGTIGDWVCHVVDPSFWALELGAPSSVEAVHLDGYDPAVEGETVPRGSTVRYEFPAKGVTLTWYSGSDYSRKPKPDGQDVPDTGAVVIGDKGTIIHGSHGASGVKIAGDPKRPAAPATLPRAEGNDHHKDFLNAIREGRSAGSDFASYGGPLTEIALLGLIAYRFPGRKLAWDGERFTDCPEANALLEPAFREGWKL